MFRMGATAVLLVAASYGATVAMAAAADSGDCHCEVDRSILNRAITALTGAADPLMKPFGVTASARRDAEWRVDTGELKFPWPDDGEENASEGIGNPNMVYAEYFWDQPGPDRVTSLGPRDAMISLLCTPPPVRYFSFRSYAYIRQQPIVFRPVASYAQAVNNLNINYTTAAGEHQDGGNEEHSHLNEQGPFCRQVVMVSTGDAATLESVAAAFEAAGLPRSAVNLELIPADAAQFRVGLLRGGDSIGFSYRVAMAENPAALGRYSHRTFPAVALRSKVPVANPVDPIKASNWNPNRARLGAATFNERSSTELQEALQELTKTVLTSRNSNPSGGGALRFHSRSSIIPLRFDTQKCLTNPGYSPLRVGAAATIGISGCFGEVSDALYYVGEKAIPIAGAPPGSSGNTGGLLSAFARSMPAASKLLGQRDFAITIVGVNHRRTGKATYFNHALYRKKAGAVASAASVQVIKAADDRSFDGGALPFVDLYESDKLKAAADDLYVHTFSSSCSRMRAAGHVGVDAPHCTDVQLDVESVFVLTRIYMEPSTGTAPTPDGIIKPVVFHHTFEY